MSCLEGITERSALICKETQDGKFLLRSQKARKDEWERDWKTRCQNPAEFAITRTGDNWTVWNLTPRCVSSDGTCYRLSLQRAVHSVILKHCNRSSKTNLLHLHKASKETNGAGKMILLVQSLGKTMDGWSSHHALCKNTQVLWEKQTQDPFGSLTSAAPIWIRWSQDLQIGQFVLLCICKIIWGPWMNLLYLHKLSSSVRIFYNEVLKFDPDCLICTLP